MNENTNQTNKTQNLAIIMVTIACLGAGVESLVQGWEKWVVPLILLGIAACWFFHITNYRDVKFRQNFSLIFSMLIAFFHGIHLTSYFDLIVISVLLMTVALILKRKEFLLCGVIEFFFLMTVQTIMAQILGTVVFDSLTISRVILHSFIEVCVYRCFLEMLRQQSSVEEELGSRKRAEAAEKVGMEDFLVNISHELRTPVNVINGMSSLILKKENREDVISIRDAGRRLSHQIEDIQDYSEIQRKDVVLENERYMIVSLINDIASNFNNMSQRKDLDFVVDLDPNVPSLMKGDSKKISKIMIHLIDNAFKFTRNGGIYLKVSSIKRDYGVNLVIEVTDTGIGMSTTDLEKVSEGSFQANKKRNRNTGGIGLGLSIVYGFTRMMGGFVTIESKRNKGTTVRVSIVQEVLDPTPCLVANTDRMLGVAFHVNPDRYRSARIREFYQTMASNLAMGLRVNLYSAPNLKELKRLLDLGNITHVFMGEDEYNNNPAFFDDLSKTGVSVIVSADMGFTVSANSHVVIMPKPLYGYPVVRVLNGETSEDILEPEEKKLLDLNGVRTLIVDDEPMNLVVATGLFKEYNMIIDTAESGKEALQKYEENDYDVIFMDHMMPEMDGIEAMKKLRFMSDQKGKKIKAVALTANAISGAKEMFLREGFDGFISKPISINDFERVMSRILSEGSSYRIGGEK